MIAHGRAGDVLLALSTSGNSRNVIEALAEARRRGLVTIAMVGYDGGVIAAEGLADHVVVTRSEHIPRIQEAQASAYHVLRAAGRRSREHRDPTRARARVEGTVQGVGFRPYVYRLAGELDLRGLRAERLARRAARGRGTGGGGRALPGAARPEAPPLAVVERVLREECEPTRERGLRDPREPRAAARPTRAVTPDSATCADCLGELFDPADRRYRYPFVNCTNCGPRFTIVRGVPYDRPFTTMAGFAMCPRCQAEYDDPADRRFHAQPNACPACGPVASLIRPDGPAAADAGDPSLGGGRGAARRRDRRRQGLGGYHLACRADDEAVGRDAARAQAPRGQAVRADGRVARAGPDAGARGPRARTCSRPGRAADRPRAAAAGRAGRRVGRARGRGELGLMLPYSPLHHLLLADVAERAGGRVRSS